MANQQAKIVTEYARMWPRDVLYLDGDLLEEVRQRLSHPGVYVLYRAGNPCYVSRADRRGLFRRLMEHADDPRKLHFNFWNFFPQSLELSVRLTPLPFSRGASCAIRV